MSSRTTWDYTTLEPVGLPSSLSTPSEMGTLTLSDDIMRSQMYISATGLIQNLTDPAAEICWAQFYAEHVFHAERIFYAEHCVVCGWEEGKQKQRVRPYAHPLKGLIGPTRKWDKLTHSTWEQANNWISGGLVGSNCHTRAQDGQWRTQGADAQATVTPII